MTTRSIRSYREASRYSGVPVTSLRDAIARGDVPAPTTAPDGKSVWDVGALDALRVARAGASAGAVAAPSPAGVPVNASTAMSSTPAPSAAVPPPATLAPVTAGWMIAATPAVHGSAHVDADDEDQDADAGRETPFWAAAAAPIYSEGHPVVDPITRVITYVPVGSSTGAAGAHPPGTLGAYVAELQQQLAAAQAQLASITFAWRCERVAAIAAEISVEALMSGTLPQVAMAARDAAHAAAAALTDEELRREDVYPQAVARGAALVAAQQVGAAIAWQASWSSPPPPRAPYDELSRARARRGARSRSSRW